MLLTGKAKKNFLVWLYSEYDFTEKTFNELYPENLKEWFIIQWFDSIGIYIGSVGTINEISNRTVYQSNIELIDNDRSYFYLGGFSSRSLSIQQAIIKANELYNQRNNNQD